MFQINGISVHPKDKGLNCKDILMVCHVFLNLIVPQAGSRHKDPYARSLLKNCFRKKSRRKITWITSPGTEQRRKMSRTLPKSPKFRILESQVHLRVTPNRREMELSPQLYCSVTDQVIPGNEAQSSSHITRVTDADPEEVKARGKTPVCHTETETEVVSVHKTG